MNEEKTLREILAKFKDGETKYKESALFHKVVDLLRYGNDPYDVIDSLVENSDLIVKNAIENAKTKLRYGSLLD